MRLILAHIVDVIHVYVFRHWPYWSCNVTYKLWPDKEHECWLCSYLGWGEENDKGV